MSILGQLRPRPVVAGACFSIEEGNDMKSLGAFALFAALAAAVPIASAQAAPTGMVSLVTEGTVIRVHAFHCEPEWSHRYGWHRHWGACQRAYPHYQRNHEFWRDRRHHHHQYGAPRWY
jgi:hypothetical protein